ncbi:hypothetical protein LEMLEM_LOCUS1943 [Lemmus lemmus]
MASVDFQLAPAMRSEVAVSSPCGFQELKSGSRACKARTFTH